MGQRIERVSDLREFSQKLTGYTGTALIFTKSFIIDFERLKNKLERLEQLEKENKELEEANKELAEENERLAEALDKLMETTGCYTECKPFQCLQYGIKAYDKRLKDSIPKSKIREKLDELEEHGDWEFADNRDVLLATDLLKELLGGSNE